MVGGGGVGEGQPPRQSHRKPALPSIEQLASPHRTSTDSSPIVPPDAGAPVTEQRHSASQEGGKDEGLPVFGAATEVLGTRTVAAPHKTRESHEPMFREPAIRQADPILGIALTQPHHPPNLRAPAATGLQHPASGQDPLPVGPSQRLAELEGGSGVRLFHDFPAQHARSEPTVRGRNVDAGATWEPFAARAYQKQPKLASGIQKPSQPLRLPPPGKLPPAGPWAGAPSPTPLSQEGTVQGMAQGPQLPDHPDIRHHQQNILRQGQQEQQEQRQQFRSPPITQPRADYQQKSSGQQQSGQRQPQYMSPPQYEQQSQPPPRDAPRPVELPQSMANFPNMQTLIQHTREFRF